MAGEMVQKAIIVVDNKKFVDRLHRSSLSYLHVTCIVFFFFFLKSTLTFIFHFYFYFWIFHTFLDIPLFLKPQIKKIKKLIDNR